MRRIKRTARVYTYVRPEVRHELERLARQRGGNVITLSEYLAEWCERHVLEQQTMEIVKQTIGGRIGNQ